MSNNQNLALTLVEAAREYHYSAAVADSGKAYDRSRDAFIAAIAVAFPALDKYGVYGVWCDCMEGMQYCADTFAKLDRDDKRKFIAMGGGFQ